MAVLNKIRERSVFLIAVIALALFAFILSGLIKNGDFMSKGSQNKIGSVNGQDVSREDFARQVEGFQKNSGRGASSIQAVNQVWTSTVRRLLLENQIDELGIDVGRDHLNQAIRQQFGNNPSFQNAAGVFDMNVMREYVANIKASSPQAYAQWVSMEDNLAEQAKAGIYFDLIRAGLNTTDAEAEEIYKMDNDKVDLQYTLIPYTSIGEPEVSKDEIKSYLKKHKNAYKADASRDIQYVLFEDKASEDDMKESKASLTNMMNDSESYNKVTKAKDSIKGFKNATNNQEYIDENSDIPFNEKYMFKSDLPSAQANQLLALDKGETFGPYQDNGYWKMAKVTDIKQIPDSVEVRHILIAYEGLQTGQGLTRTKEEAEKMADSVLKVVKNDQEKFAVLADSLSADASTKADGGELGWVNYKNTTPSKFIDYIFNASSGDYGVIETEYGFHVVNVEEVKNKQKAIQVATLAKKIQPSEKTNNDLFTTTTKFQIAAEDGDFNEQVKKGEYQARPVKGIREMQENIPGINNQRRIVQWTFKDDSKVGDVKRFDVRQGYVVVQLTAKNKKGLMSVEEASPKVTPILRKEKQAKMIADKISGKSSLEEIAKSENTTVERASGITLKNPTLPGATAEPKVVGEALSMKEGSTSGAIEGKKGVYIVKVLKKNEAKSLSSYKTIAKQETKANNTQVSSRLVEALKETAEIEDNRAIFY